MCTQRRLMVSNNFRHRWHQSACLLFPLTVNTVTMLKYKKTLTSVTAASFLPIYLHSYRINIITALTLTNVTKLPLKAAAIVTGMQQATRLLLLWCGGGAALTAGQWRLQLDRWVTVRWVTGCEQLCWGTVSPVSPVDRSLAPRNVGTPGGKWL